MARKISEIKESITTDFMCNETAAKIYGFEVGSEFSSVFSKVSFENVLFYVFALAGFILEQLFDAHKADVTKRISEMIPHRPKWYRDKVLEFMADKTLPENSDKYDTTGMTADEIDSAKIIKHAVAPENEQISVIVIKVAGEDGGLRCPIPPEYEQQLDTYIRRIKDAGVRYSLVNIQPEAFSCEVDVYYDPLLSPETVRAECVERITNYIENLPFNGEYSNVALIDELQKVEGVKIPEFKKSYVTSQETGADFYINARYIPAAGYFKMDVANLNLIAYE